MAAAAAEKEEITVWRAAFSALCASLIGIGLARFAYTPLIPALIAAHWFTPAQAAYLGAANLAGYLIGALFAGRIGTARAVPWLRTMMLVATLSFLASAWRLPFAWFFLWRFAAGASGGALMVLAAASVLPHVPPGRRGRVGGMIFTGVGLGIAASGTLVPILIQFGLRETWISFGLAALVLTVAAWSGWPRAKRVLTVVPKSSPAGSFAPRGFGRPFVILCVEYALNAVGLVPHMVFLVDYIARGLGQGLGIGGMYWTIFGIGAISGPMLMGMLADRVGFRRTLRLAFVVQAAAVALIAVTDRPSALTVSSLTVGLFVPGVVPLVLGRMHELVHDADRRQAAWSWCTTAFAIGQALAAYGFSYLFAQTGGAYALMFTLAAAALVAAVLLDILQPGRTARHRSEPP
ncbi:MAG: YbfB/YjiJ family MFS transporter [Xanthobacteraceae bacterium]